MGFAVAAGIFEQIKGKDDTREAVMLMAVGLAEMAKELEELHNSIKKASRAAGETQEQSKPSR